MLSSNNPHRTRGGPEFHTRNSHSKFKIQDCFTNPKLRTLPTHSASLEFSSKSSRSIGILFQHTRLHWNSLLSHRIHWNSLPTHSASLEFSSKSSESIGILFQHTRLHWNSLPSHPDPLEFSSHTLGFIGILFQAPRRAIRLVGHQAPRRAIRPVGHQAS